MCTRSGERVKACKRVVCPHARWGGGVAVAHATRLLIVRASAGGFFARAWCDEHRRDVMNIAMK